MSGSIYKIEPETQASNLTARQAQSGSLPSANVGRQLERQAMDALKLLPISDNVSVVTQDVLDLVQHFRFF